MSKSPYDIIVRPLFTEKSAYQKALHNKVSFVVQRDANKIEIKRAIIALFKVEVEAVHTQIVRGKVKRFGRNFGKKPNWKKATITLAAGSSMDEFFEAE